MEHGEVRALTQDQRGPSKSCVLWFERRKFALPTNDWLFRWFDTITKGRLLNVVIKELSFCVLFRHYRFLYSSNKRKIPLFPLTDVEFCFFIRFTVAVSVLRAQIT